MSSLLKSTLNSRYILPGCQKYIRSDLPAALTEDEINWLIAHNVRTIVDLRTEEERELKKCPLMEFDEFEYICLPVTGGNAATNVLYFCNARKDRI